MLVAALRAQLNDSCFALAPHSSLWPPSQSISHISQVRGAQNSKVAASYEQLAVRCVSSRFTYRFLAAAHEAYTAWQSKCDAAATHADTQLVWPDAGSDANPRSGSPSSSAAAAAGGGSSDGSSAAANGSSAGGIFGVRPHRQPQPPLSARLFALSDPDRLAARLQALEEVLADRTRTARAAREKLRARPQEIEREMKGLEEEAKGKVRAEGMQGSRHVLLLAVCNMMVGSCSAPPETAAAFCLPSMYSRRYALCCAVLYPCCLACVVAGCCVRPAN